MAFLTRSEYAEGWRATMSLRGSCLCGGVRYEAAGPLGEIARCHCRQCRKASGAEFATNASVPAAGFRVVEGAALLGSWESSPGAQRCFCTRCGSQLFKRNAAHPDMVRLRLGALDDELEGCPAYRIWVSSAPSWSAITDDLPRYECGKTS